MLATLDGRLSQLRERRRADRDVADREGVLEAVDGLVLVDLDATAASLRHVPVEDRGVRGDARGPHDDAGLEELLVAIVLDEHAVGPHLLDRGVQPEVDLTLLERALRVGAQLLVEGPEHVGRHLEQRDVDLVAVQLGVRRGHVVVAELGERAGGLDAGGTTTDDHDAQVGVLAVDGELLEVLEELVAHLEGVRALVERDRELLGTGGAEEVGGDAVGEHEVVVGDRDVAVEAKQLLVVVDAGDDALEEAHVALAGAHGAQEPRDVAGVQAGGGHLVEQRLERVVRVPVNQGDRDVRALELAHEGEAAEAASDHHDVGALRAGRLSIGHGSSLRAGRVVQHLGGLDVTGLTGRAPTPAPTGGAAARTWRCTRR